MRKSEMKQLLRQNKVEIEVLTERLTRAYEEIGRLEKQVKENA